MRAVVALNRAVAIARVDGAQAGLEAIAEIGNLAALESYHLVHAIRGALAAELGHHSAALAHFRFAEKLAVLPTERNFIRRRIAELEERNRAAGKDAGK